MPPARFVNFRQLGTFRWRWPHFLPSEMACSQTDELLVVPAFMDWLEGVRHVFGQPMVVTSGYRTAAHQERLTGRATGAHVDGMAVDVLISGQAAHRLAKIALSQGAQGIGVCQTGPRDQRYLHLDCWVKAPAGLRPWIWSY
ncbi:MAG: D-Ala-D-Ala carboxypeptidase family metallohydrolase [Alphaproteobacteria bacterium]